MKAPEIHHRHVSHLYGLFPGHDIDVRRTPALAAAVKRSLEIRGDQATGWATAWRINLWARLGDGDHAYDDPEVPAQSRADLSEHVRRAPAVPDRRQLRRRVGHRRDAAAVRRGRDPAAARAAVGVADRAASRACARAAASRSTDVEERRARAGDASDRCSGNPLRLRRGETLRTLHRTSRGAVLVFTGDELRRSAR